MEDCAPALNRRAFLKAAYWALAGAVLSAIGLIHAYTLTPQGVQNQFGWLAAPQFVAGYALTACVLIGLHQRGAGDRPRPSDVDRVT